MLAPEHRATLYVTAVTLCPGSWRWPLALSVWPHWFGWCGACAQIFPAECLRCSGMGTWARSGDCWHKGISSAWFPCGDKISLRGSTPVCLDWGSVSGQAQRLSCLPSEPQLLISNGTRPQGQCHYGETGAREEGESAQLTLQVRPVCGGAENECRDGFGASSARPPEPERVLGEPQGRALGLWPHSLTGTGEEG